MDISGKMLGGMPISDKLRTMVQDRIYPYRELMAYYNCAMMEVATKFNVLNEELSLQYDRNPIESIRTRLKSVDSIAEKLTRKGISLPLNVEKIQEEIHDIAGVRVICSYPSDIYMLSEAFRQDRKRKSHKLFSIQKFAAFTSSRINRFILSSKVSLLSLLK